MRNRFLVPVILNMTEKNGEGIDYQSLGVRHLGSIYEGLLDYDVVQAKERHYSSGRENNKSGFCIRHIEETRLVYIKKMTSIYPPGGMTRKGTGSYFTPESIVKNLIKSGLQPIFDERTEKFKHMIKKFREGNANAEKHCNDLVLDLQVLDPAMGSGTFSSDGGR